MTMTRNSMRRRDLFKATALITVAMGAATTLSLPALAQDDRASTLIIGGMAESPTWGNFENANYYAPGVDLRNGLMYASEALFWYNLFEDEHIPWMAEGYEYNDDFTSVTIRIRPGVEWSDGEAFDARDVAYTYNMLIEDGNGAKSLRKSVDVAARVKEAVVVDDLTVRVDLAYPDPRHVFVHPTSYYAHGLYWVPEHVWSSVEDKASFTNFDLEKGWPLTTSAFAVERTSPSEVVLQRRDDWWAAETGFHELPEMERIVVVPGGNRDRVSQLLVTNQIDTAADIQDPLLLQELMRRNPNIISFTGTEPPIGNLDWWPTSIYFNGADPQWDDVRVRRAMAFAVNAQQIVDITSNGFNETNVTPYPAFPSLGKYVEAAEEIAKARRFGEFDLDETARLMTEAGYEKDGEGYWTKDGTRVGGIMHGIPLLNQIGPIVQQQLRNGGFDVTFASTPDSRRIMMAGESPLMLFGHNGGSIYDPLATLEMYHSKNRAAVGQPTFYMARFSDPAFDAAVDPIVGMEPGDPAILDQFKLAMEAWYDGVPEIPIQQWYHRVGMNTTYWTNWPTADNPYMPPAVNFESTPVYVAYKLQSAN